LETCLLLALTMLAALLRLPMLAAIEESDRETAR
jgi:hypothetical protein